MFKFNVESSVFEDAVRKIMIAIPASNKQGTGDCIQMTLYKNVGESGRSVGIFLAFNAKIEAISTMEISDAASEEKEMKVCKRKQTSCCRICIRCIGYRFGDYGK